MIALEFLTDEQRPWRFGDCDTCPIASPRVVRGFGSSKSGIAVIGESPGRHEVDAGRPFVGPSGQLIRLVLEKLGQNPDEVYWTNALLCHAEKASNAAIVACNNRLHEELRDAGVTKILSLGAIALQSLVSPNKQRSITANRGRGFFVNVHGTQRYCVATYHPAAVLRDPELFRDLVYDCDKFINHHAPIEGPSPHVYVAWTKEQALRRLPGLLRASTLSCDIETTGLSSIGDMIISIGFAAERHDGEIECHIIPSFVFEQDEVKSLLLRFFNEYQGNMPFHNGKYDLRMLSAFYKQPLHPVGFKDTMLMHFTQDERAASEATFGRKRLPRRHGLKTLARMEFDTEYGFDFNDFWKIEKKTKEDWERLFYYQGLDCAFTLKLYHKFDAEIDDSGRRLLRELLYPASFALQDIENTGVKIDVVYLKKLELQVTEEIDTLRRTISKIVRESTGIRDWRTEKQKQVKNSKPTRFNPASYANVRRLIYDVWKIPYQMSMTHLAKQRRKEGKEYWSTDDITLTRLSETINDPTKQGILLGIVKYRKRRTVLRTNIVGIEDRIDPDQRLRTSFMLHGTVTGRLSSRNPNLQNIPVREDQSIPIAFNPGEGWKIVEADYSQLEIRVLAEFSQDKNLVYACHHEDIHGDIASRVFGKPANEITDFERKLTKTIVFGTLYGRSAEGILAGEEMGELVKRGMRRWSKDEAEAFIARLMNLYPGMNDYFTRAKEDALTKHCVEYSLGRKRRFPFINRQNKEDVLRQAVNAPVQGTASDICLDALIRLHNRLPRDDARVLMTIHDALALEVRDEALSYILPRVKETMETIRILEPTVPFKVKIKVGQDWGHTEEVNAS